MRGFRWLVLALYFCGWAGGVLAGGAAALADRNALTRSLVGQQWPTSVYTERLNPLVQACTYEGGMVVQDRLPAAGYGVTWLDCQGRRLMLLEEIVGRHGRDSLVRVLDAVRLPPLRRGEAFWLPGDCLLRGGGDVFFVAIVRMGQRERADWKTGVRAAWRTNLAAGKIEPQETRHIVCEQPTPP